MLVPVPGSALRGARLLCRSRPEIAFGAPPACLRRKKLCRAVQCRFSLPLHAPRGAAHHSRHRLFRHAECPQRADPLLRQMPRFASLPTPHTVRPIRYSRSLSMSSSRPRRAETPTSDETTLLHLFARTRGASTSPRTSLFRAVRPSARRGVPVSSAIRPSRAGRSAGFLHIYAPARGHTRRCFT